MSVGTWKESNHFTLVFLPRYKPANQLYFEAGIHDSFLLSSNDFFLTEPEDDSELQYKVHARPRMNRGFHVQVDIPIGAGKEKVQKKVDRMEH
jgi:hypothetical protein